MKTEILYVSGAFGSFPRFQAAGGRARSGRGGGGITLSQTRDGGKVAADKAHPPGHPRNGPGETEAAQRLVRRGP